MTGPGFGTPKTDFLEVIDMLVELLSSVRY